MRSREIRRVPEGWEHPKIVDPKFPSPYWRDPEEILVSEVLNESELDLHPDIGKLGERRARYQACRDAVGLVDGEAFLPCIDYSLDEAQAEWDGYWRQWREGTYPGQDDQERTREAFETWHGVRPDERHYVSTFRPAFESAPSCWQLYETITEGTPISPVFYSVNDLFRWMLSDGGLDGKWAEDDAIELVRKALQD